MNCPECGGPFEVRRNATYNYKECGLDDVSLVGVEVRRCKCGESPVLPDLEGLHAVIAEAVACKPGKLTAKEVRFLTKFISYSDAKAPARFGKAINGFSDAIRKAFAEATDAGLRLATFMVVGCGTQEEFSRLLDDMAKGVKMAHARVHKLTLRRNVKHQEWRIAA